MFRKWRASVGGPAAATLLAISLVSALFTHGYNLTQYPLFLTDEGIYVQQAWSLVNEGRLSPYTYFYDHAPGGWMVMAAWASVLPGEFHAFGNEVATVRVLMLLVHVVSVGLLFAIVRAITNSAAGAFVAAFIVNFSPLAVYYQRLVLLDNLMVLWVAGRLPADPRGRPGRDGDDFGRLVRPVIDHQGERHLLRARPGLPGVPTGQGAA